LTPIAHALTIKASVPYICDADTGYGNALNVIRTVHELETAALRVSRLEDQVAPKRCGHLAANRGVPAEEFVQKLRAAGREKFYVDTMIMARTDARAVFSLEEAVERGNDVHGRRRRYPLYRGAADARRGRAHRQNVSGTRFRSWPTR
jgi:2-methylisocitrate lyase-like PEP mutase family enzyme